MKSFSPIGLPAETEKLFSARANFSIGKVDGFSSSLIKSPDVNAIAGLCIFAAGSYGRLEASEHSDIDLFFVANKKKDEYSELRIPEIRMFSDVIHIGDKLNFPKFSNDGEFLKLLFLNEIEENLGSRDDDFRNHFTTRMLMMLESRPLFGDTIYDSILSSIIESYFRDYSHHPDNFRPTFLVNDIVRFWKTLCLNYEHGRYQSNERDKIRQKVKNFKLKYSRLLTCYASICILSQYSSTVSPENVFDICRQTPAERFRSLANFIPAIKPKLSAALDSYAWFMELTGLTKEDLEAHFSDAKKRADAFGRAQEFGDLIFQVLQEIDERNNIMRYLVV